MGDPRKTFICRKCGLPMVDDEIQRRWGADTPCPKCMELERVKKEDEGRGGN